MIKDGEVWVKASVVPVAMAQHLRGVAGRLQGCEGVDDTALAFLRMILEAEADELHPAFSTVA